MESNFDGRCKQGTVKQKGLGKRQHQAKSGRQRQAKSGQSQSQEAKWEPERSSQKGRAGTQKSRHLGRGLTSKTSLGASWMEQGSRQPWSVRRVGQSLCAARPTPISISTSVTRWPSPTDVHRGLYFAPNQESRLWDARGSGKREG